MQCYVEGPEGVMVILRKGEVFRVRFSPDFPSWQTRTVLVSFRVPHRTG